MDYKKKYEEALERARDMLSYKELRREDMEYLFPELKESEDEKIRNWLEELIEAMPDNSIEFKDVKRIDVLHWLEKQGEQKPTWSEEDEHKTKDTIYFLDTAKKHYASTVELESCIDWIKSLKGRVQVTKGKSAPEAVKEEKSDNENKVEPKFKVGDFIVYDYCRGRVVELTNDAYLLDTGQGIPFSHGHNVHRWTIQDAKDGDVLISELCDSIILFKGIEDNNIQFHCDYDFSDINVPGDRFAVNNSQHYGSVEDSEDFHPATNEQRDTLFAKMKEAGYEWDDEKKEIRKQLQFDKEIIV